MPIVDIYSLEIFLRGSLFDICDFVRLIIDNAGYSDILAFDSFGYYTLSFFFC